MMMRRSSLIFAFALAFAARSLGAADLPQRLNFERYESLVNFIPFVAPTSASAAPIRAGDLYIMHFAQSPEGDHITLGSKTDRNFKLRLMLEPKK
jgi:hypothetical protein